MAQGRFYVGTSGYAFTPGKENFYPKELDSKDFLRYYSLIFPFVELDFSWYTMPKVSSLEHLIKQTSPDFLFALKAHRSLTNGPSDTWEQSVEAFLPAAEALAAEGRLAAILLQFSHDFAYTERNRIYLGQLCSALGSFPVAIEFRNGEWQQQRVYDELVRRKIALVIDDGPEFDALTPDKARLTGSFGYFRFEGNPRNEWWEGNSVSDTEYDYTMQELRKKALVVDSLTRKAARVFVVFANNAGGNSARNARKLSELLRDLVQ
jgi:uncharacterized protein YecE (DUF72 family)